MQALIHLFALLVRLKLLVPCCVHDQNSLRTSGTPFYINSLFAKCGTYFHNAIGLVTGICGAIPAGLSVDGITADSIQLQPLERKRPAILPADMQLYLPALSTPCAGRLWKRYVSPMPLGQSAASSLAVR